MGKRLGTMGEVLWCLGKCFWTMGILWRMMGMGFGTYGSFANDFLNWHERDACDGGVN